MDIKEGEHNLSSPAGLPAGFDVLIKTLSPQGYHFTITAKDSDAAISTFSYNLTSTDHQSYLDLFEKLSKLFGLRMPQNRRPVIQPTSTAPYRVVLTDNLHPGMLYGYGDPAILKVDEHGETYYYLAVTSNDAPNAFPILRSADLVNWSFVDYVFPKGRTPEWASTGENNSDYWAPEIHKIGDEYRIYFVAREKHTSELCIGMASAPSPAGPFVPADKPMLTNNVIDPHVFVTAGNDAYLYWKEDNNDVWPAKMLDLLYQHPQLVSELIAVEEDKRTASLIITLWLWAKKLPPMERFQAIQIFIEIIIADYTSYYQQLLQMQKQQPGLNELIAPVVHFMKTPMYAQQLSPDGQQLVGEKVKVLENDLDWEAHLIEGMWVTEQDNKYYFFYAGNDFSTDKYGIGVAVADHPLGPYQKMQAPFLQSTKDWWAPGHPSVTTSPAGKPLLVLHAYHPGKAGYKQLRVLLMVQLQFSAGEVKAIEPML
ncbi:family 43 glycosylhydrolase [Aridibaculum aurantiacum]|uniref:family 43 glycosylhydrolase n=1 Tax=Aridibaculum aurantiacum TaxID=2810307 RepID=UPI001A9744E7|nr:family 43 glycosylhydrolase [Aridibaculum aurantiacum]